jgi:hypothetical protein
MGGALMAKNCIEKIPWPSNDVYGCIHAHNTIRLHEDAALVASPFACLEVYRYCG